MNDLNLSEEKNEILGELDYLNCFIGLTKSFIKDGNIKKILTDIQNDIFIIQANIADPENVTLPENLTFNRIVSIQKQTHFIERSLKKIDHFIIPEGSTASCYFQCMRTIS